MKQENSAWGRPHAPALLRWGRKTLSFFLSVVLCLSMLPATALAEEPTPTANADHPHTTSTQHPVCGTVGSSCTDPNHSSHEAITNWAAWNTPNAMPSDTGNYYLTTDVTLIDSWAPAAGTVLCLNGYSITRVNSVNNYVITFPSRENGTNSFTLTDCAETQGVITHAEGSPGGGVLIDSSYTNMSVFNMYGGTISGNDSGNACGAGVQTGGYFNLYGGKICNNTTTRMEGGGGVYSEATFNMYGGTIENNTAEGVRGGGVSLKGGAFNMYSGVIQNNTAKYGGGVYSHSTPFYVSGNAKIINNTAASKGGGICGRQSSYKQKLYISGSVKIQGNEAAGKTENISLTDNSGAAEPLHIVGTLTDDAYVGISGIVNSAAADGKQSSSGDSEYTITASDLSHLHSDNEEYILKLDADNNRVTLAEDTNPVAKIGSTTYTSLQAAINAAQGMSGNPTITLERDTTPASLSVTSGTFTIDLAGHSIALTTQDSAVILQGASADNTVNLTIKDSKSGGSMSSYAMLFDVKDHATLTIENGSYTSQTLEPVYARGGTAAVVVKDGTFNGKRAGITCYKGNVTIENGTFTGTQYGAYLSNGGSITIAGGIFKGGEWSLYDNYDYGRFELTGGEYFNGISCKEYNIGNALPYRDSYEFVTVDDEILYGDDLAVKAYTGYLKIQERPITKIQLVGSTSVNYGYTAQPVLTATIQKAMRFRNESVTYTWSLNKRLEPGDTWEQEELASATTTTTESTASYTVPLGLPAGEYYYTVTATCAGASRSFQSSVDVNQRAVKITGVSAKNKVYDGTNVAEVTGTPVLEKPDHLTWEGTADQLVGGVLEQDKDKVRVAVGTAAFSDKNVGTGKTVTFSDFTLTGEAAGNYRLSRNEQPESTTADITQRPVTVSGITAVNKPYDGSTDAALNYEQAAFDNKIDGDTLTVTASGTFDSADVGEKKTVAITALILGGTDADNYVLAESGHQTTTTADITKAEGSVTPPTAVPNLVYNGEMQTLINKGASTTGEVQYKLGENGTYSVELPKADKAGTHTVYYTVVGDKNHNDVAGRSISVTIAPKPITMDMITISGTYTYTGSAIEPTVEVKDGGKTLTAGTDYTVTLSNNTNAGVATVKITGNGNYSDEVSKTFNISEKPLTSTGITVADIIAESYTGSEIKPELVVKDGEKALIKGTDYELSYAQNTNVGTAAQVTITGRGNYTGTLEKTFTITPKALESSMIAAIDAQTYTGEALTPDVSLTYNSQTLEKDTDYTVEYADNINAGTNTAKVTVTGTGNYSGMATANFTINKANQSLSAVNLNAIYGKAFEATGITGNQGAVTYAVKSGSESLLTKGEDGKFTAKSGTGTAYITATAAQTDNYNSASIDIPVALSKATLTAKADDKSMYVNGTVPADLTVSYTGFVNGDTKDTVVAKDATASIAADVDGKTVGSFDITTNTDTKLKSDMENNYTVTVQNGTLTVSRRSSGGGGGVSQVTYPVAAPDKPANGTLAVSPTSAKQGDTVTITVTPDRGYVPETVTVTDKDGKQLTVTKKSDTQYTFVMPAGQVEVRASFAQEGTAQSKFVDVKESDYFYDAVQWAAAQGITSGTDAEHFSPSASCTRAQIVTFLWRAAGSPEPKQGGSFTDVAAESYYAKAVAWAVENGITTGTGAETFSPDATCTREQAVAFLYRAAGSPAVSGGSAFRDVADSAYYASAVAWAERNGITGGIGGGLFGSGNDCTRGQIVTFLYRANQQ